MRSITAFLVLLALATGCYNSSENQQVTNSLKTGVPTIENEPKDSAEEVVESDRESESGRPEENMDDNPKPEQDNPDENVTDLATTLADALAQVESGKAVLVDVRRDEEWNEFHFQSATHIPLDKINEDPQTALAGIGKEQIVFVH